MRLTVKAHDVERRTETYEHDVETRALTAQNVEEIRGLVTLLAKHIDTRTLEQEISARNIEQQNKFNLDNQ